MELKCDGSEKLNEANGSHMKINSKLIKNQKMICLTGYNSSTEAVFLRRDPQPKHTLKYQPKKENLYCEHLLEQRLCPPETL